MNTMLLHFTPKFTSIRYTLELMHIIYEIIYYNICYLDSTERMFIENGGSDSVIIFYFSRKMVFTANNTFISIVGICHSLLCLAPFFALGNWKSALFSMVTFHSNNFPDRMTITSNRIANSHTCTPLKWTAEMKRPHMLWAISALYTFIIRYCHHKSQWNRLFHSEIIHLVQILHIDWYFKPGCRHSHAFKSKSHLVFLYTPSSIYNQFSQCWN